MSEKQYPYVNHMNILFEPMQLIDIQSLVEACTDQWYNQTLCQVNDSVVSITGINMKRKMNSSLPCRAHLSSILRETNPSSCTNIRAMWFPGESSIKHARPKKPWF
jgi:hypothetical protein